MSASSPPYPAKAAGAGASGEMVEDGEEMGQVQEQRQGVRAAQWLHTQTQQHGISIKALLPFLST